MPIPEKHTGHARDARTRNVGFAGYTWPTLAISESYWYRWLSRKGEYSYSVLGKSHPCLSLPISRPRLLGSNKELLVGKRKYWFDKFHLLPAADSVIGA